MRLIYVRRWMLGIVALVVAFAVESASAGPYTLVIKYDFTGNYRNGGTYPDSLMPDGLGGFLGTSGGVTINGKGDLPTVFDYNPATGVVKELGLIPYQGALASDGHGNLYGTTPYGGSESYGTVFRFNIATGAVTTVASFTGPNGQYPSGPLTPDGQGNFIGSAGGGAMGLGTIFRFNPATDSLTSLASFSGTSAAIPNGHA